MRIEHVLEQKGGGVVTLWNNHVLRDVVGIFDSRNIASVVVTDHAGQPLGIVTDRGVIRAIARRGAAALDDPVTYAMRAPAPFCRPDDRVSKVLRQMTDRRVRHVLVLDGQNLVGLVSIGDLVKVKLDDAELESRVLRERALGQMALE